MILFKNREKNLIDLFDTHCKGEIYIPTELEQIMENEVLQKIEEKFDNREGIVELSTLLFKTKTSKKKILEITEYDKEIKLSMLSQSWEFTRPRSMFFKLIETLCYMIISNTHNLIYICFIYSMFENAGLFGLIYPLSMFGFALMEETRPRKEYWNFIYKYTISLLTLKIVINLAVLQFLVENKYFLIFNSYAKIGIYNYPHLYDTILYMLPEILILALCILNEIKLRLLGLYYVIEQDVETIEDGIQRNILKGDVDAVRIKKKQDSNMIMSMLFENIHSQILFEREIEEQDYSEENDGKQLDRMKDWKSEEDKTEDEKRKDQESRRNQQLVACKEIAEQVRAASSKFDIDDSSNDKVSKFD